MKITVSKRKVEKGTRLNVGEVFTSGDKLLPMFSITNNQHCVFYVRVDK